ncbi:MAG: hypothetical protein QOH65_1934 [Methylobacteriaceae bacterium]|jgi:predicted nucleotide-binding protein|nr:hypothetical protein [Methylobacteriaceae bacterium]
MIERFSGTRGRLLLIQELQRQKLTVGISGIAEALADAGELASVSKGGVLIEQTGDDADVYFIVVGSFDVVVNGKRIARRHAGDHIGEMAAVSPVQRRAASVVAAEDSVVLKLSEEALSTIGERYPEIWRRIARELSGRLEQRNSLVRKPNDRVRVFLMSSTEGLPIARAVQSAFAHDAFLPVVWTDGVFKISNYTLESLEDELDRADFAVAIAHSDDHTTTRGTTWPTARDNVVFELGFFMGRLGRSRSILMEPRAPGIKLPSDLAGLTTVGYRFDRGPDAAALLAPACNELREHILRLGPHI